MANIIQNTKVSGKKFAYKDNSGDRSHHQHSSSDIIDGAVSLLNKNNPSNIEELRANLGITYGDMPANPTQGAIHFYQRTGPIAVSGGGTGCATNYDVRQSINLIGVNLVSTTTDDVSTWADLGTGVVFINGTRVEDQPSKQGGFIHNHVYLDTVFQVWYSLDGSGEVYIRSGDANGWYSANGLWIRMYNQNTANKRIFSGEIAKGDKVNIGEELNNYTLFKVILKGKGTAVLCTKEGSYFRGVGGYSDSGTDKGSMTTYHVNCDIVDDTYLKCEQCNQITHQFEGGHDYFSDNVISTIYGLV